MYDSHWELVPQETPKPIVNGAQVTLDGDAWLAQQMSDRVGMNNAAQASDAVFRPSHYARWAVEPITFITANKLDFLTGNVIKYVMRHDAKNGLEDLRKAARYLEILIEDTERRERGEPLTMASV